MVQVGPIDLSGAFSEIRNSVGNLFQYLDLPASRGASDFDRLGQGGDDPFRGLSYGGKGPFDKLGEATGRGQGEHDPFAHLSYGGNPFGALDSGYDKLAVQNPLFAAYDAAEGKVRNREQQQAAQPDGGTATIGSGVGGTTYTGGYNAQGVADWIAKQRPGSPIAPIAGDIIAYAQAHGVDPAEIFGRLQAESGWATDTGMGTRQNNPGNIMAPGADPAHGVVILRSYPSMLEGVKAMVDTIASYDKAYAAFLGKDHLSLEDRVAIYYVGPEAYKRYGLQANDAGGSGPGGNGTVQDYLNRHIYPVQQALAPYRTAPQPGGGGTYSGVGGLASLTGGSGSISQEFQAVTPGIDQGIYGYGEGSGVHGHTGIDWAVPPGTQVYMPAGLSGTVVTAGGTAFFRDEDENPAGVSPPGQGELKIHLSNGMDLILGHMRSITVPVGTQLTAGQAVGLAGSASGGHVHVELRVPDPTMPNGYRIIDPRSLWGGGGANPGGNR